MDQNGVCPVCAFMVTFAHTCPVPLMNINCSWEINGRDMFDITLLTIFISSFYVCLDIWE